MFKTNNEENNAKVAALKSLIKLSSNGSAGLMQGKALVKARSGEGPQYNP